MTGEITIDKVATAPTARNMKIDTSAPMEIGMAAKDDGERLREEGDQRIVDFALQAVYKETDKGKCSVGERKRVPRWQRWWEITSGRRAAARKEAKGKRKVARDET